MKLSLIPQSLFGRLLAALLLVAAITVLIVTLLIARERRHLVLLGSGGYSVISSIVDTSTALAELDAQARREAIERLQADPIRIETFRPRRLLRRPEMSAAIERIFTERIRRLLGPGYTVTVERDRRARRNLIRVNAPHADARLHGPADRRLPGDEPALPFRERGGPPERGGFRGAGQRTFDILVTLPDGEEVAFRTMAPAWAPPLPRRIYVELGMLTIALAAVLFFMTRSITRPLSQLARAADAMGRGETLPPLEEDGARELRDATRAFNAMQDRLRRYLDSRTRVLAAISHDLRTPLTRMRLRAESIEDETLRAQFTGDLDEMAAMVRGALGMFRGLNDPEAPQPMAIEDLLSALQAEFAEMGAQVAIEGRSRGPIAVKPQALKRCLTNLLRNAVDYGTKATVQVADGRELTLRIRDEGPGIPEAELEKVFEPFYRVEASRSRDTGGTGLGLSIARDIVQAHGGSIHLRNLPQHGLEVVVTLPRSGGGI